MSVAGPGAKRRYALALGLVLIGGARADEADLPDDAQDFLEFLGSPEADSTLWNTFLDSIPDQPDETTPASTEAQGPAGDNE